MPRYVADSVLSLPDASTYGSLNVPFTMPVARVNFTETFAGLTHFDQSFDVVALPSETPLIRAARAAGKKVITGAEVIAIQAEEQFVLYTGVRPTPEQVREASEFSRS